MVRHHIGLIKGEYNYIIIRGEYNYINSKSMFLISLYGAPLAQKASYLALHSSLFEPVARLIMILFVTNSINCLLIGSRCIPNGAHTNHFWPNLVNASKLCSKWIHLYLQEYNFIENGLYMYMYSMSWRTLPFGMLMKRYFFK